MEAKLWNNLNIKIPEIVCASYSYKEFNNIDAISLKCTLNSAASEFKDICFWKEIAIFEKTVKIIIPRLPKDKFYQSLLKVRRSIQRMKIIDPTKIIESTAEMFDKTVWCEERIVFLPTKHYLEFILLLFQRMTCLLIQISNFCSHSVCCLIPKLKVGHLLEYLTMCLGLLSRISVLCQVRILRACFWYQNLIQLSSKLINDKKIKFQHFDLPLNLQDWIEKERNICLNYNSKFKKTNILDKMFDEVKELSNYSETDLLMECNLNKTEEEDIGECIIRKTVIKSKTLNKINKAQKKKLDVKMKQKMLKFHHPSIKMEDLKKKFAQVQTLKSLKMLFKNLHNIKGSKQMSVDQHKNIKQLIKKTTETIRLLKPNKSKKKKIIEDIAVKIFNILTMVK